jgi:hypothetical protein
MGERVRSTHTNDVGATLVMGGVAVCLVLENAEENDLSILRLALNIHLWWRTVKIRRLV